MNMGDTLGKFVMAPVTTGKINGKKITQNILKDYWELGKLADKIDAALKERKEAIVQALQAGLPVEEGTLTATLADNSKRNVSWKDELEKVVGAAKVNAILESTEPTVYAPKLIVR
jgi:hypothetical protein